MRVETGRRYRWVGLALAATVVAAGPATATASAGDFPPDRAGAVDGGASTVLVAIVALAAVATSGGGSRRE